jgi:hypothetical protein
MLTFFLSGSFPLHGVVFDNGKNLVFPIRRGGAFHILFKFPVETAQIVIAALNGHKFRGRTLTVNYARNREDSASETQE